MTARKLVVVPALALVLALAMLPLRPSTAAAAAPPFRQLADRVYVQQTGHYVQAGFLQYWWTRGGVDTFGFPLTEEFEQNGVTVQYFERARFEWHPDAPDNFKVQLGRLGVEVTQGRVDPAFRPFPKDYSYTDNSDHRYFPQTGHFLSYGFKTYWEQNGGLDIFGLPISEEFSENGYTVQYFERARFEYHPEHRGTRYEVQLGLLGTQVARETRAPMEPLAQAQGVLVWPEGTVIPSKWIEVDLSLPQKLTAWEGNTPVYSTLVSGGTDAHPTPIGSFSIQTKLRYDDMTGGVAGTDEYYYLPDVPFVMYFYTGGYALHGTYWHANFGYQISHGCVNLPTPAAEWIYNWAPVGTPIWIHGDPHVWR